MLALLLLIVTSQVPAVPGEGTLVSFCKQGRLTACEDLAKVNPAKAAELQAELARAAALRMEALRAAEQDALEIADAEADESSEAEADSGAEASNEPPNCTGQVHHIISRPIFEALKDHKTLHGLYKPRDKRFKTRAKDTKSHCGYQEWHREVDLEVVEWLNENKRASPEQFIKMLRDLYNRPDLLKRFPHGF